MSLLPAPTHTRLVTIVAHVDHGKTTLADSLVEHNGIISERLAGTMRYLDSMEEEQRRGITIRSSAIGLTYKYVAGGSAAAKSAAGTKSGGKNGGGESMVIHLIDSPGHVDFAQEVSSALHLCDGAILMVDVVEGMCARMHSILRETYARRLVPILTLNKVDRLCTELGLTVEEAWGRLRGVIESVNAAASAMIRSDWATNNEEEEEDADQPQTADQQRVTQTKKDKQNEELEQIWTFSPPHGNVVFASALYGWGFTLPTLARSLYRSKVIPNIKPPILKQALFAECRYDSTTGKVIKWNGNGGGMGGEDRMSMFAEFGLKPLWDMVLGVSMAAVSLGMVSELFSEGRSFLPTNTTTTAKKSTEGRVKMKATTPGLADLALDALQIGSTLPPSTHTTTTTNNTNNTSQQLLQQLLDKTNASSESNVLRTLLRHHRPVSHAVLDAVCERCPGPGEAAMGVRSDVLKLTVPTSWPEEEDVGDGDGGGMRSSRRKEFEFIQAGVRCCAVEKDVDVDGDGDGDGNGVATVAHVCKFVATDRAHITDPELFTLLDKQQQMEDAVSNGDGVGGEGLVTGGGQHKSSLLLGVARVLSGTLYSTTTSYYCFGPKHQPSVSFNNNNNNNNNTLPPPPKKSIRLYLLMGSSYVRVSSVPAGHICAIYGLDQLQLKTVTLCDMVGGMPMYRGEGAGTRPLMKVNVEAVSACDTHILEKGLAKLSLADAAIEVTATSKGERILACQGEIHLEQSILDLETIYCEGTTLTNSSTSSDGGGRPNSTETRIKLRISAPIVDFGETTEWFPTERTTDYTSFYDVGHSRTIPPPPPLRQVSIPPYCYEDGLGGAKRGRSRVVVSGGVGRRCVAVSVRVVPLATSVWDRLGNDKGKDKGGSGSEEDLVLLGKALGWTFEDGEKDTVAAGNGEAVLAKLRELTCAIDSSKGNCMIESLGVMDGRCIVGVAPSKKNYSEVYILPKEGNSKGIENDGMNEYANTNANVQANVNVTVPGKLEYDRMQDYIRNAGQNTISSTTTSATVPSPASIEGNPTNTNTGSVTTTDDCKNKNSDEVKYLDAIACNIWKSEMHGSAVAGFRSSCAAGPLCEEPIRGILVVLEGVEIALTKIRKRHKKKDAVLVAEGSSGGESNNTTTAPTPPISTNMKCPIATSPSPSLLPTYQIAKPIAGGMIITTLQTSIRSSLLTRPTRLVEHHLHLTLHSSLTGLGPLHSTLSRRRGTVLTDTMVDGTTLLSITATIPQINSFGLQAELAKKSSGEVTAPELGSSHWGVLSEDPFWIPTSLEEREEYGEIEGSGDCSTGVGNTALGYIRMVRERKGLMVDDKRIVVVAEKQRTLARKK